MVRWKVEYTSQVVPLALALEAELFIGLRTRG